MWRPSQSQKSKWTNSQLGRDTCGFLLVNCVVQRKTFLGLVVRLLVSCLLNPFSLYASSATVRQSRSAALCDDFRYLRLCRISGDRSIPLPHPSTIGRTPFDIFCKSPPLPHLPPRDRVRSLRSFVRLPSHHCQVHTTRLQRVGSRDGRPPTGGTDRAR